VQNNIHVKLNVVAETEALPMIMTEKEFAGESLITANSWEW
jgi:hypothetical protein